MTPPNNVRTLQQVDTSSGKITPALMSLDGRVEKSNKKEIRKLLRPHSQKRKSVALFVSCNSLKFDREHLASYLAYLSVLDVEVDLIIPDGVHGINIASKRNCDCSILPADELKEEIFPTGVQKAELWLQGLVDVIFPYAKNVKYSRDSNVPIISSGLVRKIRFCTPETKRYNPDTKQLELQKRAGTLFENSSYFTEAKKQVEQLFNSNQEINSINFITDIVVTVLDYAAQYFKDALNNPNSSDQKLRDYKRHEINRAIQEKLKDKSLDLDAALLNGIKDVAESVIDFWYYRPEDQRTRIHIKNSVFFVISEIPYSMVMAHDYDVIAYPGDESAAQRLGRKLLLSSHDQKKCADYIKLEYSEQSLVLHVEGSDSEADPDSDSDDERSRIKESSRRPVVTSADILTKLASAMSNKSLDESYKLLSEDVVALIYKAINDDRSLSATDVETLRKKIFNAILSYKAKVSSSRNGKASDKFRKVLNRIEYEEDECSWDLDYVRRQLNTSFKDNVEVVLIQDLVNIIDTFEAIQGLFPSYLENLQIQTVKESGYDLDDNTVQQRPTSSSKRLLSSPSAFFASERHHPDQQNDQKQRRTSDPGHQDNALPDEKTIKRRSPSCEFGKK